MGDYKDLLDTFDDYKAHQQTQVLHFPILINPYPANIFSSWKCCLLFTYAAYIELHFRLDFIMKANTMSPDQIAPSGSSLIFVHIVEWADNKSYDWQEKMFGWTLIYRDFPSPDFGPNNSPFPI